MRVDGGHAGPPERASATMSEPEGDVQADPATLLGGLLSELGQKVRDAGVDGVHILTRAEFDRARLEWFREGWREHARALDRSSEVPASHGYDEDEPERRLSTGQLLRFRQRPEEREVRATAGEPLSGTDAPHPLPLVRARDTTVQELMPHRLRDPREPRGREKQPEHEHVRPGSRPSSKDDARERS